PAGDQLGQARPGDVFHNEIRNAVGWVAGGIEPNNMVVIDAGGRADLLDESPASASVVVPDEQNLDSNDPSGGPVASAIDRSHAASANLGFDVIGTETSDCARDARGIQCDRARGDVRRMLAPAPGRLVLTDRLEEWREIQAIAPIPAGLVRHGGGQPQCLIVTEAIENLLASNTFPNMEPDRRGILLGEELCQIVIGRASIHEDQRLRESRPI